MGRIKVFLRSFCLTGANDQSHSEPAFDRSIDVSHLAEPHLATNPSQTYEQVPASNQNCENSNDVGCLNQGSQQRATPKNCAISVQHPSNQRNSFLTADHTDGSPFVRPASSLHQDTGSSQPPSPPYAPSPLNIYNPQDDRQDSPASDQQHQAPSANSSPPLPVAPREQPLPGPSSGSQPTKLSYDIISVREPLAKILAERQQLIQAQQLQRQLLGEHDYIEVYGERGSSCFYEEIAGSVTSSATYDQIGTNSNHNYQVLMNAYAVASRQPITNRESENICHPNNGTSNTNGNTDNHEENTYDVTSHPPDLAERPLSSARSNIPASVVTNLTTTHSPSTRAQQNEDDNCQLTQSIPVYSVINKATRRSNTNMRIDLGNSRPPKPPPKNIVISHHHQQTNHSQFDVPAISTSISRAWSPSQQLPSTSSFTDRGSSASESCVEESFIGGINNTHRNLRLPQPPPRSSRSSKHSTFNHTTDRPLPSPNSNFDNLHNNNDGKIMDRNIAVEDDDIESINNGYELLKSNMEEDQIDVGYEKIKESNRYSGGSISSQFYQRQLIDNGGYESVQPIYSSPSNALVEPNYEAIAPATASELAAAATAKLNAAASVIEQFLKKE